MRRRGGFLVPVCAGVVSLLGMNAPAQVLSAHDGVYSEEQRRRGRVTFIKQCSGCHGESLRGGTAAPPLTGPDFRAHWRDRPLEELVGKMRQMPPDEPARLSDEDYVNLLALLSSVNVVAN